MGARGPQPTPTSTLKLRGSWRGETRDGEPATEVAAPSAPEWLNGEARAEWDRVVPELIGRQTLSRADRGVLALYCHAWAEFVQTSSLVDEQGYTITTTTGEIINPVVVVMNKAAERLLKTADRFGLSPAAKARVRADAPQEKQKSTLGGFKLTG